MLETEHFIVKLEINDFGIENVSQWISALNTKSKTTYLTSNVRKSTSVNVLLKVILIKKDTGLL